MGRAIQGTGSRWRDGQLSIPRGISVRHPDHIYEGEGKKEYGRTEDKTGVALQSGIDLWLFNGPLTDIREGLVSDGRLLDSLGDCPAGLRDRLFELLDERRVEVGGLRDRWQWAEVKSAAESRGTTENVSACSTTLARQLLRERHKVELEGAHVGTSGIGLTWNTA